MRVSRTCVRAGRSTELTLVKGIGLKTVEKNRDRIVVAGGAPAPARKPVATGARPVAAKR